MAVTPLTDDELTQLERHINELASQNRERAACDVSNELLGLYEERAGGIRTTGRQTCERLGQGSTLNADEKANLRTEVDALAVLFEDPDNSSANVSNEMLGIYEERAAAVTHTGRDVKQNQRP